MKQHNFDRVDIAVIAKLNKEPVFYSKKSIGVPDWKKAKNQHDNYCATLERCGVNLFYTEAPNEAAQLLNDMAVVTESLAIVGNFPDEDPRQTEKMSLASKLAANKILKFVTAPGLLDSEDVLKLGDSFFIRSSKNTNNEGAAQAAFFLSEYGYKVTILTEDKNDNEPISKAALFLGHDVVLIREDLAKHYAFIDYRSLVIPYEAREAIDSVMVNNTLIMPVGFDSVVNKVKKIGFSVEEVNISELQKMGVGMQNLSLLVTRPVEKDISISKGIDIETDIKLAQAA